MKKNVITIIIVAIVCLGLGFYSGSSYTKSQTPQRGQFGQSQNNGGRTGGMRTLGGNGAPVSGEIISKDDKSLTIKLRDGGSKIVFFSTSTPISKSVSGASTDLSQNESVVVQGTANPDGSVTAQSIQIRQSLQNASSTNNR